ncbi:DUF6114 domain-containing protein [Streptomyces albidus (ex Kaewkla and Franco 2022)]|uniref:DUF6114 domain-containing protein n=1 Tax=Streptomyces albidus (ex Kaewkla and Franco 2022) TaxID=722709 RepID=UPI001F437093|nr:DUF6114 domain-containing protein [Streptomyces albidus (ex Kaewkla and Franco 2022)]
MLLIWRRWRGWRRGRPFWGGLLTVVAGAEIGVIPLAPLKVMLHQGTAGIPSVVLALILVVLGLSAWFSPQYRGLAGILTVLLAAAALVLSNLGGFMIGTLLGVVGGALIFAWRPVPADPPEEPGSEPGTETEKTAHESKAPLKRAGEEKAEPDTTLSSLAAAFSVSPDDDPSKTGGTPRS